MSSRASDSELALSVRGLKKNFGSRPALAGLDLSVPRGIVYGFLGPNGAGKTTAMRILAGLIHPDAGSIDLFGRPWQRGDRRRLFEVGALIESPAFYPFLSARENLRALAAAGAPVPRSRIEELLELVGLNDRAADKVGGYSLGMKQRLGIAGALLSDPELLLLDEPSNGLDPGGIHAMRELLRRLSAAGKTVFVSSHMLGEVRLMVDVVGIIAMGRLVREGSIKQLLAEEGTLRVQVAPEQTWQAAPLLAQLVSGEHLNQPDGEPGWFTLRIEPERASEVSRILAVNEIYVSHLEAGSDLEQLFLELTNPEAAGDHATFGVAGAIPVADKSAEA